MKTWFTRGTLLATCLAAATCAHAADPPAPVAGPWKPGANFALNLSQSAFSDNWSGGDRGSVVWVITSDLSAERQWSPGFNLSNLLQLAYGQTSRQNSVAWDVPSKTTDLIAFESVGRFSMQSIVDPYLSFRLDTQFTDQSDPLGDIHLNPIKLKEAVGVARVLEKTKDAEVITRIGFGFRQTMAKSFVLTPALEKKSFTSNDGGFEWQTSVTQPVLDKKVLYKGQLLVFQPIFYSKKDALANTVTAGGIPEAADYWKATNIDFQNSFSAAITKYLAVNLNAQWVYLKFDSKANAENLADVVRNIRKAGQFREVLALGLTYRLF